MVDTRLPDSSRPIRYAFGPFVVDPVRRTLSQAGHSVPINSKTFDLLVVLLEHRDHIVPKDELLNRVWRNIAVNENNLARQISSLRRALGQRPDQPDFVVTIPGHGYRFVAEVQELVDLPHDVRTERNGQDHAAREPSLPPIDEEHVSEPPVPPALAHRGPSSNPNRYWTFVGVAVATIAGVLGLAAILATLFRQTVPSPQARRTLQRITYDEATLPRHASWAPDGQRVVYASDREGNADLWTQRVGNPDPVRLTTSEASESQPQWSPDGRSIVFRSERDDGGLYVIPSGGGTERRVSSFGYEPQWSPDGSLILFKRSSVLPDLPTIHVVGLDGRPPRPVRPDVLGTFTAVQAAWHPDSRRVSIWGTMLNGERRFLSVPLDAGDAIAPDLSARLQQDLASMSPGRFVWARSRRHIYFEGRTGDTRNVWRITVDPETENWVDGPLRLTTGAGEETNVALSPDGTRLVFTATSNRTRLWAFPIDATSGRITGQPYPITDGSTGEVDFDARADGSKVAYRTVRAGRNELWERSIAEGQERLLLSSTAWRFTKPRWSPDGARLAFSRCAIQDSALAVAVLNTDGGGERVLTRPNVEMQAFDWSRDGRAIIGSCRFSPSDHYSSCLVPVSGASGADAPSVQVIATDPKRNLFNQRFSPNQPP